ncbi:uncharacterized protein PV06_00572 [Exophiala oligosperma]|uniref:Uncharacterized protein n=2 Tax=Chaetothyriales TaxID=34395 RepID=A0A0D2DXW4_9EURO|nr:uncharacterized protein PV06_00572 [Exophiala oligosperma]KAJ9628176.1 hypothetical protein H2204_009436 [Knufia peltigerae]KIW47923.1 hypothetical protein PV06_00572 [Exophiala oligosperma]
MIAPQLTKNDSSVLGALFDPESSLSSTIQIDKSLPGDSNSSSIRRIQERERRVLRLVDQEKPSISNIQYALSELTAIIEDEPSYASAFNNRAQVRRLLIKDADLPGSPGLVAEIFQDLARAISLATPNTIRDTVSRMDAKVLASAHTHRGYLLLMASKSERNRGMLDAVPSLKDETRDSLEEAASRELGIGGRYGNETARQLAVKTNPYAKLCGSIVREALTKEISDYYNPQISVAR